MHARNLFLTIHDKYFVIDVKMNSGVSIERRASKNSGNGNGFGSWLEERTKPTSLSAAINKEDRIKGLENGLNSSYEHAGGLGTESNVTIVKPMSRPVWITRVKRRTNIFSDLPREAPWSLNLPCRLCIRLGSDAPACARRSRRSRVEIRSENPFPTFTFLSCLVYTLFNIYFGNAALFVSNASMCSSSG